MNNVYCRISILSIALEAAREQLSRAPWDGSEARWDTAEEYCAHCLVDDNPEGEPKTKARCKLPYREPGTGRVSLNALRAIQSVLLGGRGGMKATDAEKRSIAKRLIRIMRQHDVEPAEGLVELAGD